MGIWVTKHIITYNILYIDSIISANYESRQDRENALAKHPDRKY
jgi:hypothetical protein